MAQPLSAVALDGGEDSRGVRTSAVLDQAPLFTRTIHLDLATLLTPDPPRGRELDWGQKGLVRNADISIVGQPLNQNCSSVTVPTRHRRGFVAFLVVVAGIAASTPSGAGSLRGGGLATIGATQLLTSAPTSPSRVSHSASQINAVLPSGGTGH